ncbi:glycerophosphodiester phosphodiesterase [Nonomuraea rhodomycinica]|uniref:Glycerophosphodiester phosphodiesterase n=1 Tax=Nonomuraea rhodomycinica TaxID=1712872 RepID=A0A7Y6MAC4_9ACTN|nr:glycerophosphodiester phosphodiesterase family protein [Nonomuraea rhodomycinica]NUW39319.1 glycerophosphodiester phosphodiesterase [Nonomuraea rhodomycinica]
MSRRPGLVIATTLIVLAALTAPPASAASRGEAPVAVAHRGASAYAPENTLAAFELAAEQGADLYELDVQETRDHRLVLMHDTTLARTTDAERVFPGRAPWRVSGLSLAEIRKLDAGSWFGGDFAGERVPTLAETLSAMSGSGMGLLLEIKAPHLYPGIEARVAAELRRFPVWLEPGRLVVQSFDWDSMRRFHALMPDVAVGILGTPSLGRLAELARFADQINPPYRDITSDYVRRVHARGMRVLTWTVDDPAVMRRMLGHGVDGVISNRPDVVRDVLGEDRRAA